MSVHQMETWRQNRRSHHWVTLDGENYSCSFCDSKTGSQPCPGNGPDFASKVERGEADQLTDYGQANYTLDPPDNPFTERPS